MPDWLSSQFEVTPYQVQVSDFSSPMNVWKKEAATGEHVLGGNMAAGADGAKSQYVAIIDLPETLPPIANFEADPQSGSAPLTVQFTDQSTGDITSRAWDFDDGGISNDQNPSHTFATADTYHVSLTVIGPGGSDTQISMIVVNEPEPVAAFSADVTSGPAPLTVQFTDESTGPVDTWLWEFGDGVTSTDQNPSHVYAAADTYTVNLKVTGPGGSSTPLQNRLHSRAAPHRDSGPVGQADRLLPVR